MEIEGRPAFPVSPRTPRSSDLIPWVWYAPTLPGLPGEAEEWMFDRFLSRGIAIADVDVGESHGSPEGRSVYSAFYRELVERHGFARRACLLARSRGGLMLYNWAVEHPKSVACIAGIYPVCNLTSYPGLDRACEAYGIPEERLARELVEHNPVDRLSSLARAKIPILHLHGDSDEVVPLEENSGLLAERYASLGGEMTLKVIEGQGHNMWPGWFACQELVDFVTAHGGNDVAGTTATVGGMAETDQSGALAP